MDERVILTREPLNAETRLERHTDLRTPPGLHYVRSHFPIPARAAGLSLGGAVAHPRAYTLDELRRLPARTLVVTLECAGNGRAFLDPPAPGEPWALGAVSTAEWTGVPLRSLLEPAGLSARGVEILFRGADAGVVAELGARIHFERALPLERALADEVLVAYAMNGDPLPVEHGAPLRLVVPRWYGMASVKWLAEIVVLEAPFEGFYQVDRYVIEGMPLREIRPRALVVAPAEGASVPRGPIAARGLAWSGRGPITRVELSIDGGRRWRSATLGPELSPYAWREWRDEPRADAGALLLYARATDASGAVQPLANERNALGYGNNAAQPVRVRAR